MINRDRCAGLTFTLLMLAARKITEDDVKANDSIYRTLEFFIRTHSIKG